MCMLTSVTLHGTGSGGGVLRAAEAHAVPAGAAEAVHAGHVAPPDTDVPVLPTGTRPPQVGESLVQKRGGGVVH